MTPLILLPGAFGIAGQFDDLKGHLIETNVSIMAFDLGGHGINADPLIAQNIKLMADDFLNKLKVNNIETPIHIFGHSLGGYLALYLAVHHPEKINKVFTLGTKWHWSEEIVSKETSLLNPEKMELKIPAYVQWLIKIHGENWKELVKSIAALMTDLGIHQYLKPQNVQSIQQSIRIALGDKDSMVTFEETIMMYKSIPNGQLQVYPQTPHAFEKMNMSLLANDINLFFGS